MWCRWEVAARRSRPRRRREARPRRPRRKIGTACTNRCLVCRGLVWCCSVARVRSACGSCVFRIIRTLLSTHATPHQNAAPDGPNAPYTHDTLTQSIAPHKSAQNKNGMHVRITLYTLTHAPIALPSVTSWIAFATTLMLSAFKPAIEMRPSRVRKILCVSVSTSHMSLSIPVNANMPI